MTFKSKEAKREYHRNWVAKRREAYFKDKSCIQCGAKENLELDHIDREFKLRKYDHSIWSRSTKTRELELKFCQVLCHKCHRNKTNKDLGFKNNLK